MRCGAVWCGAVRCGWCGRAVLCGRAARGAWCVVCARAYTLLRVLVRTRVDLCEDLLILVLVVLIQHTLQFHLEVAHRSR